MPEDSNLRIVTWEIWKRKMYSNTIIENKLKILKQYDWKKSNVIVDYIKNSIGKISGDSSSLCIDQSTSRLCNYLSQHYHFKGHESSHS